MPTDESERRRGVELIPGARITTVRLASSRATETNLSFDAQRESEAVSLSSPASVVLLATSSPPLAVPTFFSNFKLTSHSSCIQASRCCVIRPDHPTALIVALTASIRHHPATTLVLCKFRLCLHPTATTRANMEPATRRQDSAILPFLAAVRP